MKNNALSLIFLEILESDIRRDFHPALFPDRVNLLLIICARIPQKLHILRAAGHRHPAGDKISLREIIRSGDHTGEADCFAVIPFRMLHRIKIPDAIIDSLTKINDIGIDIKRKILFGCHVNLAVFVFEDQIRLLADRLDISLIFDQCLFINVIAAVEHDQLGAFELLK